jgi:hypothetical protein
MGILHTIKAYLYENLLTDDPNDYVARASSERSLSVADVCESAVSRGSAGVPAKTIEHNVGLFFEEMAYLLKDGYSVNTGFFTAGAQIRGVFNSPKETFDPGKHSVFFQFNMGETLRGSLADVTVEILGVAETGIEIAQVTDVKTGSVNDQLTPNRNLRIKGSKLKIMGSDASVGVYFLNESTSESIKVDAADIVTNNPSELIIVTPALGSGSYKLKVVTQFTNSALLKEPRSLVFDKTLTVG